MADPKIVPAEELRRDELISLLEKHRDRFLSDCTRNETAPDPELALAEFENE